MPKESIWNVAPPAVHFDEELLERKFAWNSKQVSLRMPEEGRKKLRVLDDRTSQLLAISFNKRLKRN